MNKIFSVIYTVDHSFTLLNNLQTTFLHVKFLTLTYYIFDKYTNIIFSCKSLTFVHYNVLKCLGMGAGVVGVEGQKITTTINEGGERVGGTPHRFNGE